MQLINEVENLTLRSNIYSSLLHKLCFQVSKKLNNNMSEDLGKFSTPSIEPYSFERFPFGRNCRDLHVPLSGCLATARKAEGDISLRPQPALQTQSRTMTSQKHSRVSSLLLREHKAAKQKPSEKRTKFTKHYASKIFFIGKRNHFNLLNNFWFN